MQRTFLAKDMNEALAAMRTQLGADAVLVQSEKAPDGRVRVWAAPSGAQPATVPSPVSFEARYRDQLIARLRADFTGPAANSMSFDRTALLTHLSAHRVPEPLAHALAQDAVESGLESLLLALATALDRHLRVSPVEPKTAGALLLLGPYGAGKTSVAARLAAAMLASGATVKLAATDVKSAGQLQRLETFAAHLQIDVVKAPTPESFRDAVTKGRQDKALLLADSAGFDPCDPPQEILDLVQTRCADIIGVVPATGDAVDAAEWAKALAGLGATRLIITCLDLVHRKGALLSLATSGVAIAHTTSSPYLVRGLDTPTPLSLARALLAPAGNVSEAYS